MIQRRTLIAATAATLATPMLRAQTLAGFPSGPVRIIVGFPRSEEHTSELQSQ